VSDQIYSAYPAALDCGLQPEEFWNMALPEIVDILESHIRTEEKSVKLKLSLLHFLAKDTASYVSILLSDSDSDSNSTPELWDYFPEIFKEEKKAAEKERQKRVLMEYKAKMYDFTYRHNHAREKGES